MLLREIVEQLDRSSGDRCIVAKKPWTAASDARLVRLTDDFQVPDEWSRQGYEYFLEVSVALDELFNGLEDLLSPGQRFKAALFYAENDAYPDWLLTLRERAKGS